MIARMDDPSDSETDSDSTLLLCEKRSSVELGESGGRTRKRVKMRDLDSVVRSEGMLNHYQKTSTSKDADELFHCSQGDMSYITKDDVHLGVSVETATRRGTLPLSVDNALKPQDLNIEVSPIKSLASSDTLRHCNSRKSTILRKNERKKEVEPVNSRISGSDRCLENLDDVSSSMNQDHYYPVKNSDILKSRTMPNGPLAPKDPLIIWKEMKQNGFLSSSQHGGIPIPKQRGRKGKDELMKKNMEIAKKEEVDKFAKMAAPSGLLSKLNPGIITNVRNMKQVRSIIQSLVRSERIEKADVGSKQESELKIGRKGFSGIDMDKENMNPSTLQQSSPQDNESSKCLSGSRRTAGQQMHKSQPISSCLEERNGGAAVRIFDSDPAPGKEDDILALKLSSSTAKASQNVSSLSSVENLGSASSLSVKAATIAFQWLELLHQDIKGRLGALRRSKRRLCAVLQTELPILFAQEFTPKQENDASFTHSSGCSRKAIANMHQTRWSRLFDQMDKGLCEEEKKMEEWLNQVSEMLQYCEKGLQHNQPNTPSLFQPQGTCGNKSRSDKMDKSDGELAVRAAAASIYSTCNFLVSMQQGSGL